MSLPSYQRLCVFHNFGDPDLWPIPVIFLDNAGIVPSYLHIKFCNNRPTYIEVTLWHRVGTHRYTHRQTDIPTNTSITITSLCEINNTNIYCSWTTAKYGQATPFMTLSNKYVLQGWVNYNDQLQLQLHNWIWFQLQLQLRRTYKMSITITIIIVNYNYNCQLQMLLLSKNNERLFIYFHWASTMWRKHYTI